MKVYKIPEEIYQYIEEHAWGKGNAEMAEELNAVFGTSYTTEQVKGMKSRRHISSGLTGRFEKGQKSPWEGKKLPPEIKEKIAKTQFKKGQTPHNLCPVGTIREANGRMWIKAQEGKGQHENWQFYHRYLWEQAHGPIPEGKLVVFKDNNALNCTLDNLMLINRRENIWINRRSLKSTDPEVNEAVVALAKLELEIYDKRKKI